MRAQAAMEFLMTMGFALLFVVAAIVTLSYFGIFNLGNFVPSKCFFSSDMPCIGYASIRVSNITFALRNVMPSDILVTNITTTGCAAADVRVSAGNSTYSILPVSVPKTEIFRVLIACPLNNKFSGDVAIYYTKEDSGMSGISKGSISGAVA